MKHIKEKISHYFDYTPEPVQICYECKYAAEDYDWFLRCMYYVFQKNKDMKSVREYGYMIDDEDIFETEIMGVCNFFEGKE